MDCPPYDTAAAAPAWARLALRLAAAYNLLWGAVVVLFPFLLFDLVGAERPRYPEIWQCVGMIVGVYGIGYLVAANDPYRHWPIVLVGLLGKIFGPIGFVQAVVAGTFPVAFGWTILTNDLIWWVPFGLILWGAFSTHASPPAASGTEDAATLMRTRRADNTGETIEEISRPDPALLLFLRHSGCTFCREALHDLQRRRDRLESEGVRLAVVHMGEPETGDTRDFFSRYGLDDIPRFSDPDRVLYRAFELRRGSAGQLFGWKVWRRGVGAALRGHGIGPLQGDGFQMPGAFVIRDGRIVDSYRHRSAADRPDYEALACLTCPDADADTAAPAPA